MWLIFIEQLILIDVLLIITKFPILLYDSVYLIVL